MRKEVLRRDKVRPCRRIVRRLFAALTDPAGVSAHRPGAFERLAWTLQDWDDAKAKLAHTEQRMVAVLDQLGLTELVTSIDGLSAVGAAAILAETGDLNRFTSARAVVKHAGLQTNRMYAARYRHLTTRETNQLTPTQAQSAVAAAILRQLYAVVAHQQAWDPNVAAHGSRRVQVAAA